MPTRRELLYKAGSQKPPPNTISATVRFRHNKKKGIVEPLSASEKMLCALRKALTVMSDKDTTGRRFFIADNKVEIVQAPSTTQARKGEPQSYRAAGRCRLRAIHPDGHTSSMKVQFDISYRDVVDAIGLADVEYLEPTTIDMIPKATKIGA